MSGYCSLYFQCTVVFNSPYRFSIRSSESMQMRMAQVHSLFHTSDLFVWESWLDCKSIKFSRGDSFQQCEEQLIADSFDLKIIS